MAVIGRGQITITIAEKGDPGSAGQSTVYNYAKNTSATVAPTSGWAAAPPAIGAGEYLWMRSGTVTPPATAPELWNAAVRMSGDKGDPGSAGASGAGIVYRGVFAASVIYYNNTLRRDVVKYSSTYYLYKGTNGLAGVWNAANWENFGAEFSSVATELLLAQLAYIENLGVKNLQTAASGQRVEITQAKNSIAFYTAAQSTPVLEIKTTSDPIFLGQGAGFQIKQPGTNISIFKGILQQNSEGGGVSVPVLPWGQPETIAQNCILQSYTNSATGKYKTGIYLSTSGTQGMTANDDKIIGVFIDDGGIFIRGGYMQLRSNNVFCGLTCGGMVSATGLLLRNWVISFMGGYISVAKTATGKYRITFSNTSYFLSLYDYNVLLMPDASGTAKYACTLARTSSYFDVWTVNGTASVDCGFTFIVFLANKMWDY